MINNKKRILYIFVFFVLFFLFLFLNQKKIYDCFYINNTKICISNELLKEEHEYYKKQILELNPTFVNYAKKIYIEKDSLNKIINMPYFLDGFTFEDMIYINGNKNDIGVIIHELLHVLDFQKKYSISTKFQEIINKYNLQKFFNNMDKQEIFAILGEKYYFNKIPYQYQDINLFYKNIFDNL